MDKKISYDFINALWRKPVSRTPVWIMRQAGRYMPQYRELRAQAGDFLSLCRTPELACAATMLPIDNYALDAAILFSDILLIADAMGLGLDFMPDAGPRFAKVVRSEADVAGLSVLNMERDMPYVAHAVRLIKQQLAGRVPLIGFAGSPWTLATYMVEGQTSKQFAHVKGMMYAQPQVMHALLEHVAQQISKSLQAQIEAGVDAVMIFDSWGGVLADPQLREFSIVYMAKIVAELRVLYPSIPVILFSKNSGRCLIDLAATGCQAVGLDWTVDLSVARNLVGNQVALQGNLDPAVLYADAATIKREVKRVLSEYGHGSGHIFNLGHGIEPGVNPDNVAILVDAVHEYSLQYH